MRVCADVLVKGVEAGHSLVKSVRGGYLSGFQIWTPMPVTRTQVDYSASLSARMYETRVLPYDAKMIRSCPMPVFHVHNRGLHVAPLLQQSPEMSAIEVTVNPQPTDRRKPYEIEMLRTILEHKTLILDVHLPSSEEGEWPLAQLPRRGLCFNVRFELRVFEALPEGWPGTETWQLAK